MKKNTSRRNFLRWFGVGGICFAISGFMFGSISKGNNLGSLLIDSTGNPITTLEGWTLQREIIRKRWLDYLGTIPANPNRPVLKVLKEDRPEDLIRQYVEYEGEPGINAKGYLIKPQKIDKPLPGVVVLHSTGDKKMFQIAGVGEGDLDDFGYQIAKLGYVVFCPVCFLWPDNGTFNGEEETLHFQERHPGSKGMAKMLFDAERAVDVLESLEAVDKNRIGTMGHSLGAKEAFYLGAFDNRVKVIVSNEGGIGIDFSNWDANWYLGKEINEFGHQHHEVLALAAPKPFLLIGGESADGEKSRPYIESVKPVYALYGREHVIELKNHDKGHFPPSFAEEWMYEWMKKYL